jgi:hypothetical protein
MHTILYSLGTTKAHKFEAPPTEVEDAEIFGTIGITMLTFTAILLIVADIPILIEFLHDFRQLLL